MAQPLQVNHPRGGGEASVKLVGRQFGMPERGVEDPVIALLEGDATRRNGGKAKRRGPPRPVLLEQQARGSHGHQVKVGLMNLNGKI